MSDATRNKILKAAAKLVQDLGAARLTLAAAAARARVSKGGLLYHFPSKQRLIEGLVRRMIEQFEQCAAAADDGEPGGFTRGYLRATLQDDSASSSGILAAVANDPALLKPLREAYAHWQKRLQKDGIDPATATIVRLAADGLWLSELIGVQPLKRALAARLVERLEMATRGQPIDGHEGYQAWEECW